MTQLGLVRPLLWCDIELVDAAIVLVVGAEERLEGG